MAILGPNGSGKSSFIKTITREFYTDDAESDTVCKVWGEEAWNVFDLRARFGIVSNDLQYRHTRDITGEEVILSGFFSSVGLFRQHITASMRRRTKEIMAFLEIMHLKNRPMDHLSSGEARRFLIGRALVHDPQALILDEPTTSLDLHALRKVRNVMRKITQAGISIILVTHHLHDIIPEITRVAFMKKGRFCVDGPKDTVMTSAAISRLFNVKVQVQKRAGYYYVLE